MPFDLAIYTLGNYPTDILFFPLLIGDDYLITLEKLLSLTRVKV